MGRFENGFFYFTQYYTGVISRGGRLLMKIRKNKKTRKNKKRTHTKHKNCKKKSTKHKLKKH